MAQGNQCLTGRQESAKNSLDLLVMHLWYLHIVFRMLLFIWNSGSFTFSISGKTTK